MRNVWNIIAAARAARAARAAAAAQTTVLLTPAPSITSAKSQITARIIAHPNPAPNSFHISQIGPSNPLFSQKRKPSCKTVKPTQTTCFQPLAALQCALLHFLYFSTPLITKTLRASTSVILHE
jgi:hypothetical protein